MGRPIIVLDTSVFIYAFEDKDKLGDICINLLRKIEIGEFLAVFSQIGIIELLSGPKRKEQKSLASFYKNSVYNYPNLIIQNLSDNIADASSDLRGKYNISTPDAIHIATAINARATKFITNDKALIKVKEIKIQLLS
jgi:predicted nucleic acid-binding protein